LVAFGSALVAFLATPEPVKDALTIDVSEDGAEAVREADHGELVERADHQCGEIAIDLRVHDMKRQFPIARRAPVEEAQLDGGRGA